MSSYLNPISSITGASADASASQTKSTSVGVDQEAFLQLFIAQLKNQDPLNPADGTEFLTQLAQFSELEQMIAIREDVGVLRQTAESAAPADSAATEQGN